MFHRPYLVLSFVALSATPAAGEEPVTRERVTAALRKATDYFRRHVATEGGYLWRYSEDLARREGEGKATATVVWVQPPGTPSVGMAYLTAYEATGDHTYLDAAREVAQCLVRGQLRSGGWDYSIEFDPQRRRKTAYRVEPGSEKGRNVTTLDDDTTQAALRLLLRVDRALDFKDVAVHDAARYGFDALLRAQYPNGAWPQRFDAYPDPTKFPVKQAGYPSSWPRTFPGRDYRGHYTLNDNTLADVIDVMLEAGRVYGKAEYRAAAEKAGGFLLLAQMPEPQPAWAQQYDADMHLAWARKFEPPAVTGGESQGVMRTLLRLARATGDRKYLEPLPRAIAYFRRSRLPDGRLARFYELKTNRPLYFTKGYELVYRDDDLPTHYAFKVSDGVETIAKEYERLRDLTPERFKEAAVPRKPGKPSDRQVHAILAALDEHGRWVEEGRLRSHGPEDPTRRILDCRTFARNVEVLSRYLAR
jgi:PelA/Pel-15E family pectate lyase